MARQSQRSQGFGRSVGAPSGTGQWEIDIRPLQVWVGSDGGEGFQPALVVVVDATGSVRAMQPERPELALAALPAVIEQAISDPPRGCRRGGPSRVLVSNPALQEPLAALLPGVPLRQGSTPLIDQAFAALSAMLNAEELEDFFADQPDTSWLNGDAVPADVGGFFEAAAALCERRPWDLFPQEGHLFRVTCNQLGIRQWLGLATSADPEHPAVLLFRSEDDYWAFEQAEPEALPAHLLIGFVPLARQPDRLQAEIQRHGWPLAAGQVAPQLFVTEAHQRSVAPTAALLRQLQAVAWALVHWIDHDPDPETRWIARRQPRRYRVPMGESLVPVTIGAFAGPPRTPVVLADALQARVAPLLDSLDAFCEAHLDADYRRLLHKAAAALAQQQPSPLLKGYPRSWCAGLVHAIGSANFLFDPSQHPHCTIKQVFAFFGVSSSVGYAHAKKVRELLKIAPLSPEWTRLSLQQASAHPQTVMVNGMRIDASKLPADVRMRLCGQLLAQLPALRGDRAP